MNKSFVTSLLTAIGILCFWMTQQASNDFSKWNVQFDFPYQKKWEADHPSEEILNILQQSYTYFSKGARCHAFLSKDQKYVLKFFQYRYHKPHWTVRYLPAFWPFEWLRQKKIHKVSLNTVLTGYHHAYMMDKEGTGTLFLHLNDKEKGLPTISVTDRENNHYTVDLNHTRFVLQRKAEELTEILQRLLNAKDIPLAKHLLGQVLDLYVSHFQLGLHDLGRGIIRNNGFIDGKPKHFDVGKLTIDQKILNPLFQREVLEELKENARKWLTKYYPHYAGEIVDDLETKIRDLFAEESANSS